MIKRLRLKFIAISMGIILAVFAILFISLNVLMRNNSMNETERLLTFVAEQDGTIQPRYDQRDALFDSAPGEEGTERPVPVRSFLRIGRFFYVKLGTDGTVRDMGMDMMFDFTREEALSILDAALDEGAARGAVDGLEYLVADKSYGKIAVFAETSAENQMLRQLLEGSIWIAAVSSAVLLVLVIILSYWVTRPVRAAFDKQRQFVSDASHELKTPLTIISANADVLENEIGENKWLHNIKAQSIRMGALVHDLLALAKTDEADMEMQLAEFNLSKAVLYTALEYESRAFEEGKVFTFSVEEDIRLTGDENRIRQVVGVLLDNALKHSNARGEIRLELKQEHNKKSISVYNTGMGVLDGEMERIFERFYRSDVSRSRETGGYGLGLAIAKSIVDAHKGKITVAGEYGKWIRFTVTFSA